MDTTFTNSENSKTSNPQRLLINFADKINLKRSILHCQTVVSTIYGIILTWNAQFKLLDGSYSVSQITWK